MAKIGDYFKNSSRILALICALSLLIRLSFFIALEPWKEEVAQNKVLIGDAGGYHKLALNIIKTSSFSDFGAHRTPAYPLFLVFIYSIFGIKPWIVLLIQIFLDAVIVIITYLIAKEVFSSEVIALVAAFLYSISFFSAYYSITLLTEIPFTFFFSLSILIFLMALRKDSPFGFLLTGALLGLATLIRPIVEYIPLLFIIILFFGRGLLGSKVRNILALLIVFLIVIFPWQFRNLRVYGHYALSTASGHAIYWNIATAKAHAEKISVPEAKVELIGNSFYGVTNPFEKSDIYKKIAVDYISKHPYIYAKYTVKGIARMFLGTARSGISGILGIKTERPGITEPVMGTAFRMMKNLSVELPFFLLLLKQLIEYLFLLIGLIALCLKDRKIAGFLLIFLILYFAVLTGPIGYSRYRVPIVPFYLVISAKGILYTISRNA